jgi:predicted porin
MKFKTTAIALAVAGTVAAPIAVQAAADEVYASARVGIWMTDTQGTSDFQVRSFASRFGMKGETDLGNGFTGFGRYEMQISQGSSSGPTVGTRHLYTGVKGDFGSVLIGQTYQTFYNFVVGPLDNPWWHSGYNMVNYRGRTADAITYAGGTGKIAFGATTYFTNDTDEEAPDTVELGASFGIGDTTLAIAMQDTQVDGASQGVAGNDEAIIGVAWSGIGIGDTTLGVSYMDQDGDQGLVIDWLISNAYVHVEYMDLDTTGTSPLGVTLGYTQSLGRKTTMYYEIFDKDADTGDNDDDVFNIMAVLKYDII